MKSKKDIKNAIKRDSGTIFLWVFAAVFAAFAFGRGMLVGTPGGKIDANGNMITTVRPVELTFSDILRRGNEIATMKIRGNDATGTLNDGTKYTATIAYDPELLAKLSEGGAVISIDTSKTWIDYLGTWVPILMGIFFIWWIFRGFRGGAGGLSRSLAQSNPTKIATGKPKTTFKDVAGIDSEKQELMEIVDFLKNKEKFRAVGARVPRGLNGVNLKLIYCIKKPWNYIQGFIL